MRQARLPLLILGAAAIAAFAWIVSVDSHLTFVADDWELLLRRQGWGLDYFVHPFHGNILIGEAAVYKLMLAIFGMGSALPYFVLSIAVFAASAVLLFVYLRRRCDEWLALAAAVLVLFLGAAFEDLMFAFQVGYFAAVACGLGMLIALDREERRGDRLACLLLALSILFSSVGLAFAVGALADWALGRRPRLPRFYVALLPIALYALWWLAWGHVGGSNVSPHNVLTAAKFAYDSAAAAIVSLLGLASDDGSLPGQPHLIWGQLLLVPLLGGAGYRVYRERGISRALAVALAIGLGLWLLTALNHDSQRLPTSSRYQYPSAVVLLLILGEVLRGIRFPRLAVIATAALVGLSLWGGISLMHREYVERWRPVSDYLRTRLAAVEVAGSAADPKFPVGFSPLPIVAASKYFSVAADYGTPAYSEAEIGRRPRAQRNGADIVIGLALDIKFRPSRPGARPLACESLRASAAGSTGGTLRPGRFVLENPGAGSIHVRMGRFSSEPSFDLGPLRPRETATLRIPADNSSRPWRLGLEGEGTVRLCAAG